MELTTSGLFNEPQGGYEPNCHQKQAELANFISGNAKFLNNNLSSGDINEGSFYFIFLLFLIKYNKPAEIDSKIAVIKSP